MSERDLTKRVDLQPSWNCLDAACHPIETFWCEENRMEEKNISWLDAEPSAYFEDSRVHLNFLSLSLSLRVREQRVSGVCAGAATCSALFTPGLCESLWMETGGGGGIMSAPVFPSVTMKDVDWGHIEQRCSGNMKGPSNLMRRRAVCLRSVLTCIHIAACQPPFFSVYVDCQIDGPCLSGTWRQRKNSSSILIDLPVCVIWTIHFLWGPPYLLLPCQQQLILLHCIWCCCVSEGKLSKASLQRESAAFLYVRWWVELQSFMPLG